MTTFIYGWGGSLLSNEPIEGITHELDLGAALNYGGKYFIAESMNRKAAEKIAQLLGGTLQDIAKQPDEKPA